MAKKGKHPGGQCKNCGNELPDKRRKFCGETCKLQWKADNKVPHLQQHPDYDGPDVSTRFQPGNRWWEARSSHGRNPIFSDSETLRDACMQYFQWVDENPLFERKAFSTGLQLDLPKLRMMTIQGLCLYIGVSDDAWADYRKNPDLSGTVTEAERIIAQQKLTGSAADLLNANIVCREMGLRDKQEHEHTGKIVNSVEVEFVASDETQT